MKTVVSLVFLILLHASLHAQAPDGVSESEYTGDHLLSAGVAATQAVHQTWEQLNAAMDVHVVPIGYAGTTGTATFAGPLANTQRRYQLLIHENQLTAMVGQEINAISWRLPASATAAWPTAEVSFTTYDVYMSESVAPVNRSLTFSENIVGPQTQVRSGPLTITAGAYPSGSSPNDWGPEITCTPWLYAGGHLLVEIRHLGFTGTSRSVDAIGTSTAGYGTNFSGAWVGNYSGTTGSQGNFSVIRITAQDTTTVSVGEDPLQVPGVFALEQNYPNPFNPETRIGYTVPRSELVTLKVFDVLGREVATLVNEVQAPGSYERTWNASGMTSGVYFYRLRAGEVVKTRKLVLMR